MNTEAILSRIKQYPLAVGSVVLSILLIILLSTRGSNVANLETRRDDLEKKWSDMQQNDVRAVGMADHVNKIREVSSDIKARLMVREQKAINYQYFYSLERDNGISLTRLSQSDVVVDKTPPGKPTLNLYSPIEYSVSISGPFRQVIQFLHDLEHGKYFTWIDNFSVSSTSQTEKGGIQVSMTMDTLGEKE